MSVDNADEATEAAEQALSDAGYEGATVGDAHQETSTWIVEAESGETRLNVHVDAESEECEIAELGD
jgi:hypothetical protein